MLSIILLVTLEGFSQIGKSYRELLDNFTKDISLSTIDTSKNDNGSNHIIIEKKDKTKVIASSYFFDNNDICYSQRIMCPSIVLNSLVKDFNIKYVKISELKWKDYSSNSLMTVNIDKEVFYLDVRLDSK